MKAIYSLLSISLLIVTQAGATANNRYQWKESVRKAREILRSYRDKTSAAQAVTQLETNIDVTTPAPPTPITYKKITRSARKQTAPARKQPSVSTAVDVQAARHSAKKSLNEASQSLESIISNFSHADQPQAVCSNIRSCLKGGARGEIAYCSILRAPCCSGLSQTLKNQELKRLFELSEVQNAITATLVENNAEVTFSIDREAVEEQIEFMIELKAYYQEALAEYNAINQQLKNVDQAALEQAEYPQVVEPNYNELVARHAQLRSDVQHSRKAFENYQETTKLIIGHLQASKQDQFLLNRLTKRLVPDIERFEVSMGQ